MSPKEVAALVEKLGEIAKSLEKSLRLAEDLAETSESDVSSPSSNATDALPPRSEKPDVPTFSAKDWHAMTIRLPKGTWELVRRTGAARARKKGGRSSLSLVIAEAVEAYRGVLEAELPSEEK